MAPEVMFGKGYDTKVDIWSLGVLLYILLSGFMPFPAKTTEELKKKVGTGELNFSHKEFNQVSIEGKNLIRKMLVVDP